MKILWLSWRDKKHPLAGGAELVADEIAARLVKDGHDVVFLVGKWKGAKDKELRAVTPDPPKRMSALEAASDHHEVKKDKPGFWIVRVGSKYTVYPKAFRYFNTNLRGWPDLVIDECNTMPFFSGWYSGARTVLLFHMLCREIWFKQFVQPFSTIGYLVEPVYLRLLKRAPIITVSQSSKKDLVRQGKKPSDIHVISEGIDLTPVDDLKKIEKFQDPTLLAFGSVRAMKRTLEAVQAFELAKKSIPNLKLIIAGDTQGSYARRVMGYSHTGPYRADIEITSRVDGNEKTRLMQESHILLGTSIKEGWGLTVTEASSQGTPAIVYNVDGLRDSVRNRETGIVTKTNTPAALANEVVSLLRDQEMYRMFQRAGWEWSRQITFDRSYQDFKKAAGING